MNLTLDNGKPVIKFRHNDKGQTIDDLLLGEFIKLAKNGLTIGSSGGFLNTTSGESFTNYVIRPAEPTTVNREDIINAFKTKYGKGLSFDDNVSVIHPKPNIKTGLADDEQPEPIPTVKGIAGEWIEHVNSIHQEFKNQLNNEVLTQLVEELSTIIKRDQEIKDKLKVAFAENCKALDEVIQANKRIEVLIINL